MTDSNDDPAFHQLDVRVWAYRQIRQISAAEENVVYEESLRHGMSDRNLFSFDVLHILRTGKIEGEPTRTKQGDWQCTMIQRIRDQKVRVTVVILNGSQLFVSLAEWEDEQ